MNGRVVSNKQIKTAIVLVEGMKRDPLYKKSYLRSKRYAVDDPIGVKIGDLVEVIKIKPVSKRKHWRITKVVGRDIEEVVNEQLKESAAETIGEVMPEEQESKQSLPSGEGEQITVDSKQLEKTEEPKKEKKGKK